jgi:hypothetical protein
VLVGATPDADRARWSRALSRRDRGSRALTGPSSGTGATTFREPSRMAPRLGYPARASVGVTVRRTKPAATMGRMKFAPRADLHVTTEA